MIRCAIRLLCSDCLLMFLGKGNKLNHGGQKGWVFIEENYLHMLKESQYISQFLDIRRDSKIQDCGRSWCAF